MEPKREPKWSPKASQDGTKKEKKSEVKLRELSEALGAKKRNKRRSRLCRYEAAGGGRGDGGNLGARNRLGGGFRSAEFAFEVRNCQIRRPDAENQGNRPGTVILFFGVISVEPKPRISF